MTDKRRRQIINSNMRGAADIAKQAGKDFSPVEKTVVFLYLFNMLNDRSLYGRDVSEFDSHYVDEGLTFLFTGMKSLGEYPNEKRLYRICESLTREFRSDVSDLQARADAVNRRS